MKTLASVVLAASVAIPAYYVGQINNPKPCIRNASYIWFDQIEYMAFNNDEPSKVEGKTVNEYWLGMFKSYEIVTEKNGNFYPDPSGDHALLIKDFIGKLHHVSPNCYAEVNNGTVILWWWDN